jgi:hypothetical protein
VDDPRAARYYHILELKPGVSAADLRQAYLDLVRVWHPDRFEDPPLRDIAVHKIKEINEAYRALKDFRPAAAATMAPSFVSPRQRVVGLPLLSLSHALLIAMVAAAGTGGMMLFRFLREPARQLEAINGQALRIAHRAGPNWADAFRGWEGVLAPGMERLLAIYNPAPPANNREVQVFDRRAPRAVNPRPAGVARSGAGEIQLHNRTGEETLMRLASVRVPSMPLRAISVLPGRGRDLRGAGAGQLLSGCELPSHHQKNYAAWAVHGGPDGDCPRDHGGQL